MGCVDLELTGLAEQCLVQLNVGMLLGGRARQQEAAISPSTEKAESSRHKNPHFSMRSPLCLEFVPLPLCVTCPF